jgi:hypothetical protein
VDDKVDAAFHSRSRVQGIKVPDVLNTVAISRSALEKRSYRHRKARPVTVATPAIAVRVASFPLGRINGTMRVGTSSQLNDDSTILPGRGRSRPTGRP